MSYHLMSTVLLYVRHGVFFALILAPALLMLGAAVRAIARRHGISYVTWQPQLAFRYVLMAGLCGIGGQAIFAVLSVFWGHTHARMAALAAAVAALGLLSGPAIIPYFCRWKAVLLGISAAVPATWVYQAWLVTSGETAARLGVAALLIVILALAVTLPVPETHQLPPRAAGGHRFCPWLDAVSGSERVCPAADIIHPVKIVLQNHQKGSRWR